MTRHVDVAVLQPSYLPWLGYFDLVALADTFVIYDDVQFDRGGWRNRNRLLGHNGAPQWLTVPVQIKGHMSASLREVQLPNDRWAKKHAATLRAVYGRAPHFEWCYPALETFLLGHHYTRLLDLCLEGHRVLADLLGVQTPVRLSSELGFAGAGRTERLVEICRLLGASRYVSGDAARAYMDEPQWASAQIELAYHGYPHPAYAQRGKHAFVSHLSVVDALMFAGPAAQDFVGISHDKERS
ncbi:WbqC family protein [Planctomycetota bacterium]|nr:WbqC family protein [Planctomycetota bacterium]